MPELSNLLRQGLSQAQNGASAHPDADTITAYVEQSLPAGERQTVVAHLAVCEPCREVVALSQPLPELAVQPVLQPAPVSTWRRLLSPAFGLVSAVAAMAIIAVAVLQLPHNASQKPVPSQQAQVTAPADQPANQSDPSQPQTAAQNSTPQTAEQKATVPAGSAGKSYAPAMQLDESRSAAVANRAGIQSAPRRDEPSGLTAANAITAPPTPLPARSPALTAGLKKDYVNTDFFANSAGADNVVLETQNKAASAAPQPQGVPAAKTFTAGNKITNFADLPANTSDKNQQRLLSPLRIGCTVCTKMAQATAHTLHLRAITPAIHGSSLGTSALGGLGMFSNTLQKDQPSEVSAAPAKAETSGLASSEALSFSALGGSNYAASPDSLLTAWRVAGGKLMKSSGQAWEDAYPAAAIEFSCVTSRGKDVWAGGKNTVLIHTRDGGATWETIKLGDTASGTIVSILAGASNVQVKTSDNQLWLSSDGGKNWTLGGE
jgi:photosystem II stability/assembly factor-like uncharacterized protein